MTHYAFTPDPANPDIPFGPTNAEYIWQRGYKKPAEALSLFETIYPSKAANGEKSDAKDDFDTFVLGASDKSFATFVKEFPGKFDEYTKLGYFPGAEKKTIPIGKEAAAINKKLLDALIWYYKRGRDTMDRKDLDQIGDAAAKLLKKTDGLMDSGLAPADFPISVPETFRIGSKTGVKDISEVLPDYEKDIRAQAGTRAIQERLYGKGKKTQYDDLLRRVLCAKALAAAKNKQPEVQKYIGDMEHFLLTKCCPAITTLRGVAERLKTLNAMMEQVRSGIHPLYVPHRAPVRVK